MLVMHGISDGLNPPFGSIALYDSVPSDNKALKQYPIWLGDLRNESGKHRSHLRS